MGAASIDAPVLPARYAPVRRLGAGGGGEVWTVRDRIGGRLLALKALSVGAGSSQHEVAALVREATMLLDLSSSIGSALPTVERFGRLADGRPFLVRELIEGESLASYIERGGTLLGAAKALLGAAVQLTQLHRAAILHGDIKPANIIVKGDGSSTLVDLGLATAWGPSGARPEGLTPRFAAPELFEGEALTVRGEVYALGASLRDAIAGCEQGDLDEQGLIALQAIEKRATARDPSARYPSVDEVGAAIAAACGFAAEPVGPRGIWTIVATDGPLSDLVKAVEALAIGEELAVVGPAGSGGRTLMAALAWRLAIHGWPVAWLRGSFSREALDLELATALGGAEATPESFGAHGGLLIIEDSAGGEAVLEALRKAGARIVSRRHTAKKTTKFTVKPLPEREAFALVRRALPSLPEAVLARIVSRAEGRPGKIRAIVDAIADRAIVRAESVDVIVTHIETESKNARSSPGSTSSRPAPPEGGVERVRELLDAGRVADAEAILGASPDDARTAVFRGWIALTKGDYDAARAAASGDVPTNDQPLLAERGLLRSKIESRTGAYDKAIVEADAVLALDGIELIAPAVVAETLQSRGMARVYRGDDGGAIADLQRAITVARKAGAARIEALVHSSLAIAHQRAGRAAEARVAYREAIAAAEAAGDAAGVATARLNLGTLAWAEGDLAAALGEFEAAADLGRRVQKQSTVERALLNLAFVDLHLGRYARVATTLKSLEPLESNMTPAGRAQLLGTRAELAGKTGDIVRAGELYRATMAAWHETGRPQDAAEVVIDEIVMRRHRVGSGPQTASLGAPEKDLEALENAAKEAGKRALELAPQLALARGLTKAAQGDDRGALEELDDAAKVALEQGANEWRWQIHAARARLLSAQGSHARARRDADEAAAILEEMAAKLPRDLREVFWDEPRRRMLRQANEATVLGPRATMAPPTMSATITPASTPPSAVGLAVSGGGMTQFVRLAEDRLARILAVNRDLACEVDLERLLARVTDQAIDLLGADRGFVLLADDDDTSGPDGTPGLAARAARDRRKDDPSVQFSRSIAERVLRTAESIVTNNAATDARLGEAASVHAFAIHSVACVPIPRVRGGDRAPIGVLYLETRGARPGKNTAMEQELPTLLAFADQVGIAIANAKLVDENRRRADDLAEANKELEQARVKLDEALARRTEQYEKAKADLVVTRQALRGHTGYAGYKGLVGTSNAMRKLYALIDRVKATDVPVLITGESGTGKEVVARAIHQGGERSKRPFLGVNCGAIPANLLESELFGHAKGAFTGADRERKGLFREAEGGTILLDEIGEMPLKMQAGLLRVLQEKQVRPVGGNREESVDARVICATNRDLEEMVASNTFREDLFYRINVVALRLPSLRERADDVPLLVDYFLGVFAAHYRRERKTLSRDAIRRLQAYAWPGNVRQLEHVLLNAFVLTDGPQIEAEDLALPDSSGRTAPSVPPPADRSQPISAPTSSPTSEPKHAAAGGSLPSTYAAHRQTEKERILSALERAGWNRLQAAKICGIPRRTFYRRLKEYGIQG